MSDFLRTICDMLTTCVNNITQGNVTSISLGYEHCILPLNNDDDTIPLLSQDQCALNAAEAEVEAAAESELETNCFPETERYELDLVFDFTYKNNYNRLELDSEGNSDAESEISELDQQEEETLDSDSDSAWIRSNSWEFLNRIVDDFINTAIQE